MRACHWRCVALAPYSVFATRSPNRPNRIGLTVVKLLRREGARLLVRGVDMLDGSPILDLKPVLSSVPEKELRRGWLAEAEARSRAAIPAARKSRRGATSSVRRVRR